MTGRQAYSYASSSQTSTGEADSKCLRNYSFHGHAAAFRTSEHSNQVHANGTGLHASNSGIHIDLQDLFSTVNFCFVLFSQ